MGLRKYFAGGFLVIGLLVVGFIFLIRSCLSKFDERAAVVPVLLIEKDGQQVLFSLVKFEKTTSYQQSVGFTSKSVSTTWFAQTNDPQTGAAINQQKIKHHSDIKHWPVQAIGSAAGLAWVFVGEIMAFDPFTLEKKADKSILESKTPALKGKLSDERRYYKFNRADGSIFITANDGTFWKLNTATLVAEQREEEESDHLFEAGQKRIEALREKNRKAQDSLYQNDNPSKLYASGKIGRNEFAKLQQVFFARRDLLYKERDSLQRLLGLIRKRESEMRQQQNAIESFQRGSISFHSTKSNQDTTNGQWLALYSKTELEKLYHRLSYSPARDDAARRQLIASVYIEDKNGDYQIEKEQIKPLSSSQFFLQGGFLLDKQTALPIRLQHPAGYLVVHKDKIGNEGKILVSRVDLSGKLLWTMESGLTEWDDWIITRDRLIILGADNPELTSTDCNVLWSVDLVSGKAAKYDYFTGK